MVIRTVPYNEKHLISMKGRVHHNNDIESRALFGDDVDGYAALAKSIDGSDKVFAVTKDDIVMAIFGIKEASVLSGRAFPWLVCSEEIMDCGITFLKQFRTLINEVKKGYRILDCLIFSGNIEVIKMLDWVDFRITSKEVINGFEFYHMAWMRTGGIANVFCSDC